MRLFIVLALVSSLFIYWIMGAHFSPQFHFSPQVEVSALGKETYSKENTEATTSLPQEAGIAQGTSSGSSSPEVATHVSTPLHVKAIYMSSWVAGTPSVRERLIKLIDTTEINAVVIDVKDNTGTLSWDGRIRDLEVLIKELHQKNIYVIARIAAFQDPLYVKKYPEQAVKDFKTGGTWKDHKGIPWVDTGSKDMWKYLVDIGKESHTRGFDELNYDYIRFPTDGALSAMRFPVSGQRGLTHKREIVQEFYKYLHDTFSPVGIPISGDLFGIIATNTNETKTLGQDLGDALTYFDYVALMVYPSHYYPGTAGYQNPAAYPGQIISFASKGAEAIVVATASSTGMATSTLTSKLRPWYQDFDMGATYTAEMVRAQISAGEKFGIMSWMLWDPANKYTPSALKRE
jgi:hypothetical protein